MSIVTVGKRLRHEAHGTEAPEVIISGKGLMIDGVHFPHNPEAEMYVEEIGWHVEDEETAARILMTGDAGSEYYESEDQQIAVSEPRVEEVSVADSNDGPVAEIPGVQYAAHCEIVARRADHYLEILSAAVGHTEEQRCAALEAKVGPSYKGEIMSLVKDLGETGNYESARPLIEAIGQTMPSLLVELMRAYGCAAEDDEAAAI